LISAARAFKESAAIIKCAQAHFLLLQKFELICFLVVKEGAERCA